MGGVILTTGSQAFMILVMIILVMIGGPFRVGRWLDMVRLSPGPPLRRREAATVSPTLLG
jgi:hypothetical protein